MRQLNKWQNILLLIGGALMVVGAGMYVFGIRKPSSWIFLVGALAFASMQLQQVYEGKNFVIRRLRRMMILSDLLFLLSALLMFASMGNVFGLSQIDYITYIYNKWVLTLLIAAVLQLYSTHRIDHELAKEADSSSKKL